MSVFGRLFLKVIILYNFIIIIIIRPTKKIAKDKRIGRVDEDGGHFTKLPTISAKKKMAKRRKEEREFLLGQRRSSYLIYETQKLFCYLKKKSNGVYVSLD